jgi:hypothetical protein
MAFKLDLDKHNLSVPAASDIPNYTVITLSGTSALQCHVAASTNLRPFGANDAASYARGEYVAVFHGGNIKKLRAAASVGAGAEVGVASFNGAVGPALISASGHWAVGQTLSAAAAGEIVSVFIDPRKV